MTKVTCDLSVSVDGYSAGLNQTEERPFGDDGGDGWGSKLHAWYAERSEEEKAGDSRLTASKAFIIGRNMFGPVRGEWDREWNGWWGDDPPYHAPVFVLTHYPRDPQPMDGGTTFYFVTDGIESALEQAKQAADGEDVLLGGGANVIQQYLAAGLVDEFELHIVPVLLGDGERLLENVGNLKLEQVRAIEAPGVTHIKYRVAK